MTTPGTVGPDGLLVVPTPIDVVPAEHAEPVLEAAHDELTVLRLELAAVEDELAAARADAAGSGIDPGVIATARARLSDLVQGIEDEADGHAAAVAASAAIAAAEVLRRAEDHAHLVRSGQPFVPAAPPTVAAPGQPLAGPATGGPHPGGWAGPAAATAPALPPGWVLVPHGALATAGLVDPDLAREERPAPEPYARTLGLLQVLTWSILVAAVLVVGLAWFA